MAQPEMVDLSRSEIRAVAALLAPIVERLGTRVLAAKEVGIGSHALGELLRGKSALRVNRDVLDDLARHFKTTVPEMLAGRAVST